VEKGVVPDSQAGFRKERGTMDNVYILDHLVKSELKKKEENDKEPGKVGEKEETGSEY
jgi:hypothetical protein